MNFCTIYILKNRVNSKVYIGQTWKTPKDRGDSGYGYKGCIYLEYAIKKYGWDQFYYKLLDVCNDQETADYLEQYYIKKYNSVNIQYGYNLKEGGSHGKHSNRTKQKISQALLGKKPTKETIEKRRIKQIGNKSRSGQVQSIKERQRRSNTMKGKIPSNINMLKSPEVIAKRQRTKKIKRFRKLSYIWYLAMANNT
jgi:group I intron endonuclease